MKTGDIILIPFPFAELSNIKIRPAALICETNDVYRDMVICAISSVVPSKLSSNELLLKPDHLNNLRKSSVLKVDRIVTVKKENLIAKLGKLNKEDLELFKQKFVSLIKSSEQ